MSIGFIGGKKEWTTSFTTTFDTSFSTSKSTTTTASTSKSTTTAFNTSRSTSHGWGGYIYSHPSTPYSMWITSTAGMNNIWYAGVKVRPAGGPNISSWSGGGYDYEQGPYVKAVSGQYFFHRIRRRPSGSYTTTFSTSRSTTTSYNTSASTTTTFNTTNSTSNTTTRTTSFYE